MGALKSALLGGLVLSSLVAGDASTNTKPFKPSFESARQNGPQIFNAVHNAMREFGSALHHNGMSMFPAVVPEGTILYHGTHTREVPRTFEWLAFEIEHGQVFAQPLPKRPPRVLAAEEDDDFSPRVKHQNPILSAAESRWRGRAKGEDTSDDEDDWWPGYLHIYQAKRPLRLLYIDGMAAGNNYLGMDDTQDYLLTYSPDRKPFEEHARAADLCKLTSRWSFDGFIRMEIGFEVIYCNFTDGLDLISAHEQPGVNNSASLDGFWLTAFEWARAASQRYHGIGSSRVTLDFSSMVSAFFYPVNLANPNPNRPELPRLLLATKEELQIMKHHVESVMLRGAETSTGEKNIDWQGVTDMVVSRYVQQFPLLRDTESRDVFKHEINNLLNLYIDYSENDEGHKLARQLCNRFYLLPVEPQTVADHLVKAAIENTTATICSALFKARELMIEHSEADSSSLAAGKEVIKELMDVLQWSEWKECGPCQSHEEVCFIAMWPLGNVEDHYNPSCLNYSVLGTRRNYWWMDEPVVSHSRTNYETDPGYDDKDTRQPAEL